MPGSVLNSQRDFSSGELDIQTKRRDDLPIMKAGGRQMSDWRVLNSGIIQQRPGRTAKFLQPFSGRVDEIQVAPGLAFYFCFDGNGAVTIRNSGGTPVAISGPNSYPWNAATVDKIVWTVVKVDVATTDVVICFPNFPMTIARYTTGWNFLPFSFATDTAGNALVPFLRIAAPGATMTLSASAGVGVSMTLLMSAAVFVAAHVGVQFRFANQRMVITAVTDALNATATAIDAMLPCQNMTVGDSAGFALGQAIQGATSGCKGIVVAIPDGSHVTAQVLNFAQGFLGTEPLEGPNTKTTISAVVDVSPIACTVWDEQIISAARGWPQSCTSDRGRLVLCDLPSTPNGILWSGTGSPYDFQVGALATNAMAELIAGNPRIYHIGAWYDEIVFTDRGVWYIPVGITTVLAPGNVSFLPISNEAASQVRPAFTSEGFLYVNAGNNRINAILGTGAAYSTRPYIIQDVTQYHTHLFAIGPKAIAVATGDGQFPERYVYVTMLDGSSIVGRYEPGKDMQVGVVTNRWIGWMPWNRGSPNKINWISTLSPDVIMTTTYPLPLGGSVAVLEAVDDTRYVDASVMINAPLSALAPGAGFGPLWWLPGGIVYLVDGATSLGYRSVDAKGFIIAMSPGEDLSSPTLTAGQLYTPIFEPFVPNAEPGQDAKQRTKRRSIGRAVVTVQNSTGFVFAKLYSGPSGPHLPNAGDLIGIRRVTAWNQDDNQDGPPVPLREQSYSFRPSGRAYDPRVAVIKDTPGPLQLIEVGIEVSV